MARTSIAVASGSTNGDAIMTSTALTAGATGTNGYVVTAETKDDKFGLVATNSGSATGVITIKASDVMEGAGIGDASFVVGGSVTKLIGPLEGARFRQSNGDINVDSGVTGLAYAVEL